MQQLHIRDLLSPFRYLNSKFSLPPVKKLFYSLTFYRMVKQHEGDKCVATGFVSGVRGSMLMKSLFLKQVLQNCTSSQRCFKQLSVPKNCSVRIFFHCSRIIFFRHTVTDGETYHDDGKCIKKYLWIGTTKDYVEPYFICRMIINLGWV